MANRQERKGRCVARDSGGSGALFPLKNFKGLYFLQSAKSGLNLKLDWWICEKSLWSYPGQRHANQSLACALCIKSWEKANHFFQQGSIHSIYKSMIHYNSLLGWCFPRPLPPSSSHPPRLSSQCLLHAPAERSTKVSRKTKKEKKVLAFDPRIVRAGYSNFPLIHNFESRTERVSELWRYMSPKNAVRKKFSNVRWIQK